MTLPFLPSLPWCLENSHLTGLGNWLESHWQLCTHWPGHLAELLHVQWGFVPGQSWGDAELVSFPVNFRFWRWPPYQCTSTHGWEPRPDYARALNWGMPGPNWGCCNAACLAPKQKMCVEYKSKQCHVPGLVLDLQSLCTSFLQVFMANEFAMNLGRGGETVGLIQDNQVPLWEAQATLGWAFLCIGNHQAAFSVSLGEMPAGRGEVSAYFLGYITWQGISKA